MKYTSFGGCTVVVALMGAVLAQGREPAAPGSVVVTLKQEAKSLRRTVASDLARKFLDAVDQLPPQEPRTILRGDGGAYYTPAEAASLTEDQRTKLRSVTLDEAFYYQTRYGSPLAYVRALDILARAGLKDLLGRRVVDFGYGSIGHLRLMALLGADVLGIEVDPLLRALYTGNSGRTAAGSLTLLHGKWPADPTVAANVGDGFDLFISKNTLKNGYIHPAKPVDKRMTIDLGVSDGEYVRHLARIVKPGGFAMLYNLCPAPNPPDKPYIPWADGRSPFPREIWESAGFRVLKLDEVDDRAAREMGKALGWDQGPSPMDLQKDLFAWYTLVRKL